MSKLQMSAREKNIAIVLVVVVCVSVVYRGFYIPFKNKSEEIKDQIEVGQRQLSKNLRIIQRGHHYEEEYKLFLEKFQQGGSDAQVMSGIITEIESVASAVNLRIADMKPQRVRQAGSYNNFSVSLVFEGELTPIMNFIYNLQTQPHLFAVDEMRLDKKSPNSTELRGHLVLVRLLIP